MEELRSTELLEPDALEQLQSGRGHQCNQWGAGTVQVEMDKLFAEQIERVTTVGSIMAP